MSIYRDEIEVARQPWRGGGAGLWKLHDLNHVTVILGKNGSGKSNLLRTIRAIHSDGYHYVSPERAGDIVHEVNIMQEELNGSNRANRRQQNLSTTYRQEAITRIQALLTKIGSLRGRRREETFTLDEIESALSDLLPEFEFKITGGNPTFELTRTGSGDRVSNVNSLSSGEAEVLSLALDLLTMCCIWEVDSADPRILLIDEPDTHLHPDLQQHLADFLIKIVEKYKVQLIIATHSTALLSALGYFGKDRTSVIYINSNSEDQSAMKFDRSLQELSTCLGGHALMGPLFGSPLLLVEGDDENRIWGQVPRYRKIQFAVIPCGGDEIKKFQKTLEKIFSALRNPGDVVGYALLDGDKGLPVASVTNPQEHIKFIKLACHESENLFLTDEVLALMGFVSWQLAIEKIRKDAPNYGVKSSELLKCDQWDRKTADIKNLIVHLEEILSPKKIPWTVWVAKCLGVDQVNGQLADFLGHEVISALWKK